MHIPTGPNLIILGVYGLFMLAMLAFTVFWIVELVDVARREFPDSNTKIMWLLVVLLAHGIGAIIYHIVGRPQGAIPGQNSQVGGARY